VGDRVGSPVPSGGMCAVDEIMSSAFVLSIDTPIFPGRPRVITLRRSWGQGGVTSHQVMASWMAPDCCSALPWQAVRGGVLTWQCPAGDLQAVFKLRPGKLRLLFLPQPLHTLHALLHQD